MNTAEIEIEIMGREYPVEVIFSYTPEVSPQLSGYPEDCYPGEPEEYSIEKLFVVQHKPAMAQPEKIIKVSYDISDLIPLIEDELIEAIKESYE